MSTAVGRTKTMKTELDHCISLGSVARNRAAVSGPTLAAHDNHLGSGTAPDTLAVPQKSEITVPGGGTLVFVVSKGTQVISRCAAKIENHDLRESNLSREIGARAVYRLKQEIRKNIKLRL